MAEKRVHDCEVCPDCLHDGNKCCGCYDGVCCQEGYLPRGKGGAA